jgi:hypothetical protein
VADVDVTYDPITVNSGPVTVAVTGLNDIKVDAKVAVTDPIETKLTLSVPEPVKGELKSDVRSDLTSDGKFAFTIPEPIRTDAKAAIDLQPVVLDQCLRLSLGPLPATRICLPNRQRIGLTLFGIEVLGLTLEGEAQVLVGEPLKQAHVVSLGQRQNSHEHGQDRARHHEHHDRRDDRDLHHHDGGVTGAGLRVRLGD